MTILSVMGMMFLASPATAALLQVQEPPKETQFISTEVNVLEETSNHTQYRCENSNEHEQTTTPYECKITQMQRSILEYVNKHNMTCTVSEHNNNIITPLFRRFTPASETHCVEHYHFVCVEQVYADNYDNNDNNFTDNCRDNCSTYNYLLRNYNDSDREIQVGEECEMTIKELYFYVKNVISCQNSDDAWQEVYHEWEVMQKHCEGIARKNRSNSELGIRAHKTKEAESDVTILPFPEVLIVLIPEEREYTFIDILQSKVRLPIVIHEQIKREAAVCEVKHRVKGFPFLLISAKPSNSNQDAAEPYEKEIIDSEIYNSINGNDEEKQKVDKNNNVNTITASSKVCARTCNKCNSVILLSAEFLSHSVYFNKWCVPSDFVYYYSDANENNLMESNKNCNKTHWCNDLNTLLQNYSNHAKSEEYKAKRCEQDYFNKKNDNESVHTRWHTDKNAGYEENVIDSVFISKNNDDDNSNDDINNLCRMSGHALSQEDQLVCLQRSLHFLSFLQLSSSLLTIQKSKCNQTRLNDSSSERSCELWEKTWTHEVKNNESSETVPQKATEQQTKENKTIITSFTGESMQHFIAPPCVRLESLSHNERYCNTSEEHEVEKLQDCGKTQSGYELADVAEQIFANRWIESNGYTCFKKWKGDTEINVQEGYNREWNLPEHSLIDILERAIVNLPYDDLTLITKATLSPSLEREVSSNSENEECTTPLEEPNSRTDNYKRMQPETCQSEEEEEEYEEKLEVCVDALLLFLHKNVSEVQLFVQMCKQL